MIRTSESQNLRNENSPVRAFVSGYRDLQVYQKSFAVSLDVHRESLNFPKTEQYSGLADQMRRASKGICANIAEGFAKQQGSKAEFKRFLLMAIGSAHEMQVWVDYCRELGYIDDDMSMSWVTSYDEIVRMLQSLYTKS